MMSTRTRYLVGLGAVLVVMAVGLLASSGLGFIRAQQAPPARDAAAQQPQVVPVAAMSASTTT